MGPLSPDWVLANNLNEGRGVLILVSSMSRDSVGLAGEPLDSSASKITNGFFPLSFLKSAQLKLALMN